MFLSVQSATPEVNGQGETIKTHTRWFRVTRIRPDKVIALGVHGLAHFAKEQFDKKFGAEGFIFNDYRIDDEYKGDMKFMDPCPNRPY